MMCANVCFVDDLFAVRKTEEDEEQKIAINVCFRSSRM